jgi:hypothetical protein
VSTLGDEARRALRRCRYGILATASRRLAGHPFASVTPFVTDHAARPVLLVSALAEHTKNMRDDPRVSLLVHEPARDVQAAGRLTVVGRAEPLEPTPELRDRYLRYQPDAARLLELGDFAFRLIVPEVVRYIAGFGRIEWIPAASFAPPANTLEPEEAAIIEHMNADHADALRDGCRALHARESATVEMAGIDCDGFDLRADDELLRADFERPVTDAGGVRAALAELARRWRSA